MGAGARQRGDMVIRRRFDDEANEVVSVKRSSLNGLHNKAQIYEEKAEKCNIRANNAENELYKAKLLIERLRIENKILKEEKKLFINTVNETKHCIDIDGNPARKYAIALVVSRLNNTRLI